MAHKVHVGQQFDDFSSLENAVVRYQNAECVKFFTRSSRKLEQAQRRMPDRTFNPNIKYIEVNYHCIHGGKNFKGRGDGKRKTSTYQNGCKAHITARVSSDGKKLEIRSLEEQHNHVVNPELFRNLPHNRKLDNEQKENVLQMLEMKANKKIIQSHVMKSTGRILLMKDIHNIKQSGEKKSNDMSTLQSAVNELNKCNGAFVKLQTDGSADDTLTGLFFQDSRMRQVFSEYPEFLCIDATYKVNDLRMPLYLLIIENGNGQSEICGIWVVANECEETIQSMVNIFKEQNPKWTDTKTIMTDKDFVEREVFSGSFPDAKLRICLFHVLRTFRREVTTEKMSVNKKQRDALLETLQKTAYSRSLEEYEGHKQTLANLNVTAFDSYFQNSWDPIKEQGVIGLTESTSLGNNTNNRVESMNQKIKQVIDKNAKFDAFASDLVHFLHMHRTEINGKICKTVNKVSTAAKERNSDDFNYHRQLTDYGYNLVSSQLQKHADVEIIETWNGSTCISNGREYVITESTCTCDFYHQYKLPCKHIFALRKKKELSLFEDSLVSERWTKSKYLGLLNQTATDAHIETFSSQPTRRAVSQQERFRQAFRVSQKLASVAAENTGIRFEVRLNQLKELLSAWENSQDVVITRVANEEDQQASGSATTAQEITYTETTIEHEHQDDTDETENDQIFDQDRIAPVDNSGPHALETQAIITATISNENKSIDEDDNNSEPDDESVNSEQLTSQIRLSGFADTWTGAHAQIERDLATSDSRSTLIPHSTVTVITQIHSTNSKADDESDDDGVQITQPRQPSKPVGTRPKKRLSLTQRRSECAPLVDRQEKPTSATAVPTSVVHEQNDLPPVVPDKQRKRLSLKLRRSIGGLPEVQQKRILVNATEKDNEMHENERLVPVAVHNDEEIAAEQLLQLAAGSTIDPANGDFSETEIEPSTSGESTSTISTSNVISGISLPPKIPKRGRPKGSELTVIGIPRKRMKLPKDKLVPFEHMTEQQQHSTVLSWLVDRNVINKCMTEQYMIQEEDVEVNPENISLACKEVDVSSVQQYFHDDAWQLAKQATELRQANEWTCYVCSEELETRSIACDRCLLWFHYHCASISAKPKTKFWYCIQCRSAAVM